MTRRLILAVAATVAASVPITNAAAQSSASQIHALRSGSDDDADGVSEYTMLYWARALGAIGAGSYATISHYSKPTESISLVDDPTDLAWARLIRSPATTSINSADDPSRPENAEFFNPPTLTDEHADAPSSFAGWIPSLFTTASDESTPAASAAVAFFASPSLPGADAWTSSDQGTTSETETDTDATDESTPDVSKFSNSLLAPVVDAPDAPDFAVVASPEPGTLALLATGFVGIAGIAIKRRRAVA